MIRVATEDDIPKIIDIAWEFFAKSNLSPELTPSPVNFAGFLAQSIVSDGYEVVVAVDDEKISGFTVFYCHNFMTEEQIMQYFLFFVCESAAGKGFGRMMLNYCENLAREKYKARRIYFESGASFSDGGTNAKMVDNMLAKAGFSRIGSLMMKGIT